MREGDKAAGHPPLVLALASWLSCARRLRSEVHDDDARRNHRDPEDHKHGVGNQQRPSEPPFGARPHDREDVLPSNGCPLVRHEPMLPSTGP